MKKIAVSAKCPSHYYKGHINDEIKREMALQLGMAFLNNDLINFQGFGTLACGSELVVASIWVCKNKSETGEV